MRRTGLVMLLLTMVFVPVFAQSAYMAIPVDGSTTSDQFQTVEFTFDTPSAVDTSTIELWVDGVMYTTASPEVMWAAPNLYFNPTTAFTEGEVVCSLAVALDWGGSPLDGIPVVSSFYVDLTGPYVIKSGLTGSDVPLPTTVTDPVQGGEWYVVDDASDMDPFSIVVEVDGIEYTYPSAGLSWENHIVFSTDTTIDSIAGADTFYSYIDHYADHISFDPTAAGVSWNPRDTIVMTLMQINDTPDYGTYNELVDSGLNSFFFFVDHLGPTAQVVDPILWRGDETAYTSCSDQHFTFDVYDDNGVDMSTIQISARGATYGYSATYFDVDTIVIDTVFHLFVPDTVFKVWAVQPTYDWESRCNIEDTYTEGGYTYWAVMIYTPLPPMYVISSNVYLGRDAAKAAAYDIAAAGNDALIELITPDWGTYATILENFGCAEGETVYVVSPDDPVPGNYLFDTLVTGRAQLNTVANMYYPEMGWGIEPVFGRISHPFFAAVSSLVPVQLRFTYTPTPELYEGELFHLELLGCDDIYGNPLESSNVVWNIVTDRSAPYMVDHYPEHNAVTTNLEEPIWVQLADEFGAVDPTTIRMHIETSSGYVLDIDSLPVIPWDPQYSWDPATGVFTWDPATAGVSWNQGDTVTVIFEDVADSIDLCESNQFAHEHTFVTWVFYVVDGPYLTNYYPTDGSFTACQDQQIGFTLYDSDGIDESTVIFRAEGRDYDITSEDTSIVCYWLPIGGGDSILVGCDTVIYNPLQYMGSGNFVFDPPADWAVNARQIECSIVQARDMLGNHMWSVGDFSWSYIYDFTGPVYFDPQPAPGGYASGESLVISIALRDSVSERISTSGLYFSIGGSYFGPITHPDYCWWDGDRFTLDFGIAGTHFSDGEVVTVCLYSAYDDPEYLCTPYANMAAGLPYCWSFTVDDVPPNATLIEPLDDATTACSTQEIRILLSDNLGIDPTSPVMVVNGVIYTMTSSELALVGDTLVFTPSIPWDDGEVVTYSLNQVSDIAGNTVVHTATNPLLEGSFIVDMTPPAVVSTSPEDGAVLDTPIDEITLTLDDISGLTDTMATMTVDVIIGDDTTNYAFTYADGFFTFGTAGMYYTVSLDLVAAGVYLPARGAEVNVGFTIQDAPDYFCFAAPELVGNELVYNFSFSLTPGWQMSLLMVPTMVAVDTMGDTISVADTSELIMGATFGATDGYDDGVDIEAPPLPPPDPYPVVPPAFLLDSHRLIADFKSLTSAAPSWMIWTGTTAGTLWWDTSLLPDYGMFVINPGNIDMRSTNHFVYDAGMAIYINFSPEIITLHSGWNLVSVPVDPVDPTPSAVFNVPASQIFWYNPWSMNYEFPTVIYPGYAYFVLYIPGAGDPDPYSFSVPGAPIYNYNVIIPGGWNTFGSVYDFGGVPVTDAAHFTLTTPTSTLFGSGVYAFDAATASYVFSPSIVAGKGYWGYVEVPTPYTSCELTVQASWLKPVEYVDPLNSSDIAHIDVNGTKLVLALQNDATDNPDQKLDRLMPPAIVNSVNPAYLSCGNMQLSRDVRPEEGWTLVITVDNATLTTDRALVIDGTTYDGTFHLSAGTYKVEFGKKSDLPKSLALFQNTPNPFNPVTDIAFDLPTKSDVKLEVFNMLGQKIRTLASNEMNAGHHTIVWNGKDDGGRDVVSGIYFYRLTANDNSFTRKMVLLR